MSAVYRYARVICVVLVVCLRAAAQQGAILINASCNSTCTGNLGDNIFPDGDFGSGVANVLPVNPGLAPGYSYQINPPPNDGSYCIANSTVGWGSFAASTWIKIQDNGPEPNGYMMVVNASYQPGLFYRKEVQVCENTLYEFSIDVISMNIPNPNQQIIQPEVIFEIDGNAVCTTNNISVDQTWHHYRFSFTTQPGVTQVTLSLRNNAPGGYGNDLAIDNISFRACGPEIDVPATVFFCAGKPLTIQTNLANSPYNTTFYAWQYQPAGTSTWQTVPGLNSQNIQIATPANGDQYRLVAANTQGNLDLSNCRSVSMPTELVLDDPSAFAIGGEDTILCNGAPAVLDAGSYTKYHWSTGATTPTLSAPAPGWYSVTVTTVNGCTATDSLYVYEVNLTAAATWKNPTCAGDSTGWIKIENWQGGIGPVGFSLAGGPVQDQPYFGQLTDGQYIAEISDSLGCRLKIPVQIAAPPPLTVSLGPDRNIYACDTLRLNTTANYPVTAYSWEPAGGVSCANCPDPLVMPASSAWYVVHVTDSLGCRGSDSLLLTVLPRLDVYAPNVFRQSYSDNRENNSFTLYASKSAVLVKRLDIFDRWGELVFHRENELPGAAALRWDGTDLQGRLLDDGVFVWLAEIVFTDGQARVYSGDVTVLTGQ